MKKTHNVIKYSASGTVGLFAVTVVTGVVGVSSARVVAESATASVSVSAACTLASTVDSAHSDTVDPDTYKENIGTTSMTVTCNDTGGYSIYAVGYSNDTIGNTNLIGSSNNIATGTAISGATSNWAMKLAPGTAMGKTATIVTSPTDFSAYAAVPAEYAKVATYTSTTDGIGGSSFTTTYRAFITSTQAPDVYTGKVKYTLVHPNTAPKPIEPLSDSDCPANTICYAPNADGLDGDMSSINTTKISKSPTAGVQTAGSSGEYTLIAPNFAREGYGFAGWSTEYDANTATNPIIYGPNETITTSTSGTGDADVSQHGLILYPVWIASEGSLQDDATTVCSSLTRAATDSRPTLASVSALTDERDNNTYAIAKLSDNHCWMIENLRLNAENTLGDTNKNLSQGYGTYSGTGTNYGNFIGLANSEDAYFNSTAPTVANNATNSIYSSDGSTSININSASSPAYRIPRYNNNNTNIGGTNSAGTTLTPSYSANTNSAQWYGYGNYYSWPAAAANTNYYSTINQDIDTTSICPSGWRLPKGGDKTRIEADSNNEFWNLITVNLNGGTLPANYSSSTRPYYTGSTEGTPVSKLVRKFPNNFIYSGDFSGSKAYNRSSSGHYWSSSVSSGGYSYSLYFYSSSVYPGTGYGNKYNGYSVRCLAL